jgi:plastocyanin
MKSGVMKKSVLSIVMFTAFAAMSAPIYAADQTIVVEKFLFAPKEITVAPGTRVIWVNKDETPHTVSSKEAPFTSKALDTNDQYSFTFDKAGDFNYFCTLHPFMVGTVHVKPQ